jgi:hypothetical protein
MLRPAGSTRFQDLFHSPRRGAFHLSLTVLVHYRSSGVFSLGPWAAPLPTRFLVSGGTHVHVAHLAIPVRLRDSHPLRSPVPAAFGSQVARCEAPAVASQHHVQPHPGIGSSLCRQCGLGSSRFARRYYGNPLCSSGYVRCFSSPGSLRIAAVLPFGRGLPHSDTIGSSVASTSPTHFVAWPRPSSAPDA